MAGRVGKAASALAVLAFCWYMRLIARVALELFYPATHVPILKPLPKVPPGTLSQGLAWREPFEYEASVYVSPLDSFLEAEFFNASALVWSLEPQSLAQRRPHFDMHLQVSIPEPMRTTNATSLYAFLFVQKAGQSTPHPNLRDPRLAYARAELVQARPRRVDRKHSLVDGKDAADQETSEPHGDHSAGPWVPHGKTRLSWEIVLEDNVFFGWRMPLDIAPYVRVGPSDPPHTFPYIPLAWENPLAARLKHWTPLTTHTSVSEKTPLETVTFEVEASLRGVGLGWFRLCNHVHHGLQELLSSRSLISYTEADVDSLKEMVYEVNPTMLLITIVAMALHMLFEFLAYKEDVSFWSSKSKADLHGISRSSVLMGVASSWIRLLYMWDQRRDTNVVVLFGTGASALVEGWRLTKVLSLADLALWRRRAPKREPSAESEQKGQTQPEPTEDARLRERVQREVDQQTGWYMARVCVPLLVAYAAFSLVYQKHESHMSWLINVSLVTVYSLEFIGMWPQLLINHKLKTVEMLPLTAFLYRFLVTFIDDLYALVIPMPLLERIGTLRDDVVFVVLCYQWLKFPRRKSGQGKTKSETRSTTESPADAEAPMSKPTSSKKTD
ncbi:Cleft lip and palate associated transmembrane protein 1 [Coemansia nantahalensis]|uniref:Cleft lip and palate associated transmembrane protein 1 n=1 Tax=Coemansia nantahalensis TaxID=2789366 RepID=A0ACC1JX01_9FUNG|nr:Cleft lip and palate associated transmembrane protein 1 [Coemansia nantahalensis]